MTIWAARTPQRDSLAVRPDSLVVAFDAPPLVVGHRGVRGRDGDGWPLENTMPAFAEAQRQGARAIELDVQASLDGEAVVVHDPDLARVTGGHDPRRVADLDWVELRAVVLQGGGRLSKLSDVLDWAAANDVAVNVEVKRDGGHRGALVRRVARLVRHSRADVLLSSFDPLLVSLVGALAPRVPRVWLIHPEESPRFEIMAALARRPIADGIHPRSDQLTAKRMAALRRHGLLVGAYTVNEADEARRLAQLGIDWIITDRPRDVRAWLDAPVARG